MSHPFADFYGGKRVLISGHTSFAGGWLAAWLKLLGAQVCGYGLPPSARPNFFDATLLDRGMTSIFGDPRNRDTLANAFADFQPEIVLHYPPQLSAPRAKADPVDAFAASVMGTVHILEEARQIDSVRALVLANAGQIEGHKANDLRNACSAGAEFAAAAYISEFFHASKTAVATARMDHLIGGGDWSEGELVPEIVRAILDEKPIAIETDSVVEPWQHVLEPVRAHLLLAQKLFEQGQHFSGAWNFAPPAEAAVIPWALAENIVEAWGAGDLASAPVRHKPQAKPKRRPTPHQAQSQLGWNPSLPLRDAIAWTVEWYKAFYEDPASSWRTTEDQIQRYMRSAVG